MYNIAQSRHLYESYESNYSITCGNWIISECQSKHITRRVKYVSIASKSMSNFEYLALNRLKAFNIFSVDDKSLNNNVLQLTERTRVMYRQHLCSVCSSRRHTQFPSSHCDVPLTFPRTSSGHQQVLSYLK